MKKFALIISIIFMLLTSKKVLQKTDSEFYAAWGVTLGILLGLIFEEKYVGFSTSGAWWRYIVRPVVGVAFFAVVSAVLKVPGKYINGEMFSLFYRMARYAVSAFVIIGPYPITFRRL